MSEERTQILQMLSDGKINAEEAAELLEAAAPAYGQNKPSQNELTRTVNQATPITYAQPSSATSTRPATGMRSRWTNWANNLEGMRCDGANLDGAFFFANNLDSVDLSDADVENAKLFATNLDSAIFEGANLRGARILCSNLDGANFRNANLEGVLIFGSNFDSANMEGADLRGQTFIATNMDGFNAASAPTIQVEASETVAQGPIAHV